MVKIHPLASVSPNAKLGENVEIGPYAFVDDNVEIGDNCKIHPHATIYPYVKMGNNCEVYPGAVVGAEPQDLKFEGEVTYVEIGNNVTIRECATINRGTKASGKGVTKVGDNTLIMSYVHVAHDCVVGNHCILVSYVGIAGETVVDDWAIIGGNTAVHQFSHIGTHAMVGGCSAVNKDIPPYSICGRTPICYAGKDHIFESMEGLKFKVGPKSFYQTNSEQAYELYKVTREAAALEEGDILYDLYTGTGTIANFCARQCKKVVGIEYVPEAIEDAKVNSAINGIDNTVFYAGDMKKVLDNDFIAHNGRPDVIILDPPRAGVDEPVIDVILNAAPKRIVYVSCNPATQARDLALMSGMYRIVSVQPVDMFPHTHHVENVVKLEKI